MEPPAKRIKLEQDLEANVFNLATVSTSADIDSKEEEASFKEKGLRHAWCMPCKTKFHTKTERTLHRSNWHYRFLCKACDKGFPHRDIFDAHKKTHPDHPIKCLSCRKRFLVHSAMIEHLESGHCTSGANAELLARASDDFMNQRISESEEPPSSNLDPTCPPCGTVSNTMSQVIAHLENRTCTARGWLDDYKPLFKAIQQRIVEEKGSPPECAVCNRDFANVAAFKQHLKDKHNPSYCFSCRKKFKSVNDREYHNVHLAAANKGQFHCVDCRPATTFGTEKEYDDHKREAHAACGPCGLTFKDVGSLLEHDYTVHFTCRQCSRRHASLEEYGLHCNSHRTPLEAVNAATGLLINMSKGEISRSQATAIINEVILKTGGTIPVIEAETEVIPTAVQEQVTTAAPLINAPAPVKAEAKVTPATRTTNTPAETQPGPTTTPAVEPPAQNKRRKKKQPPQKVNEVEDIKCRFCSYTSDRCNAERHKGWCNSSKQRSWCDPCREEFLYESFSAHMYDSLNHFSCEVCVGKKTRILRGADHPLHFDTWEALVAHVKETHVTCIPCNEWFLNNDFQSEKDLLKMHNEAYHWPELCISCDMTFPDTKSLQEHKKTHSAEPIECLGCSKTFDRYSRMLRHLESGNCKSGATHEFIKQSIKDGYKDPEGRASGSPLREYFSSHCHHCRTEFPPLSLLLEHYEARECIKGGWQKSTGAKKKLYDRLKRAILAHIECSKCNIVFKDQRARNEHMWVHYDRRYCYMCKNDHVKINVSDHFQNLQEGHPVSRYFPGYDSKQRQCTDCNPVLTLTNEREFYNHCWKEHHACAMCSVTYDNREDLSAHDNKVHRKCGICAHLAPTWWDLRTHCTAAHGVKLPLQPITPPESMKASQDLSEATGDSSSSADESVTSEEEPEAKEETLVKTNLQVKRKQGLITEWFNA